MSVTAVNRSDVQVFSFRDSFTDEDMQKWAPLRPKTFTPFNLAGYALSPSLKNAVLNTDIELLHLHGIWTYTAYASLVWWRRTGKPLVVSPRGMLDPWALENSRWKKKFVGLLYANLNLQSAACVHALCESEYESIRAYGLKNAVAVIPNGVDLTACNEKLKPSWLDIISRHKRIMLFLGRIDPKKNVHGLIEAWNRLRFDGDIDDWVLIIAGWSRRNAKAYEQQMRQKVIDLKLRESIFFTGPLYAERKRAAFQNADCFILPSYSEGVPMAVLEAWSYGLPVIMTPECNIPEGFEAKAAIKIQPDVEPIKRGIEYFLSLSDTEQENIGLRGQHLVKAKFAWPKIASQMIEVYKWLLGQGDIPACVRLD